MRPSPSHLQCLATRNSRRRDHAPAVQKKLSARRTSFATPWAKPSAHEVCALTNCCHAVAYPDANPRKPFVCGARRDLEAPAFVGASFLIPSRTTKHAGCSSTDQGINQTMNDLFGGQGCIPVS